MLENIKAQVSCETGRSLSTAADIEALFNEKTKEFERLDVVYHNGCL